MKAIPILLFTSKSFQTLDTTYSKHKPSGLSASFLLPYLSQLELIAAFACMQLGPDVCEKELLAAFRRFGHVTGHSMIRRSHCAFVDFESPAAAAEAKHALNGATFASCRIRLEFKVSGAFPIQPSDRWPLNNG